jgi:hypothetical protein
VPYETSNPATKSSFELQQHPNRKKNYYCKWNSQFPEPNLRKCGVADIDTIHAEIGRHEGEWEEDDSYNSENEDSLVVGFFTDGYRLAQLFHSLWSVQNLLYGIYDLIRGICGIHTRFFLFCAS